jgi:hypothetical protein
MTAAARRRLFTTIRDHLGMHVKRLHARMGWKVFRAGASVRKCDGSCCLKGSVDRSTDERIMQQRT